MTAILGSHRRFENVSDHLGAKVVQESCLEGERSPVVSLNEHGHTNPYDNMRNTS